MKKNYEMENIPELPMDCSIAIVQAQWHAAHTNRMVEVCAEILEARGVKQIRVVKVPGCYEIPLMAKTLAKSGKYRAIVVFGAIVKGDTDHYQMILETCTRELGRVMFEFEVPVINEILPVTKLEHLVERSSGAGNKGIEAAQAAIETIRAYQSLSV
jgi:6,7-dimethyl-8-ribityllumazine synthase